MTDNQGLSVQFPALYLTASLMSHSCIPNTYLSFDREQDFMVTVSAATKIRKGEKLTRCAVKNVMRADTRTRKKMLAKCLIDCSCKRYANGLLDDFVKNFDILSSKYINQDRRS